MNERDVAIVLMALGEWYTDAVENTLESEDAVEALAVSPASSEVPPWKQYRMCDLADIGGYRQGIDGQQVPMWTCSQVKLTLFARDDKN